MLHVLADLLVEMGAEFVHAKSGLGGDREDFHPLEPVFEIGDMLLGSFDIHFIGDDAPGTLGEFSGVEGDFFADSFEIGDRITALGAAGIDDEEEDAAAHDVAEEVMAEADVLMRAFDQTRDVSQGATTVFMEVDDAHHRLEGGEGIVGDLGLGRTEGSEQRGLASVGEADEAGIGDAAEFEVEAALFTIRAWRELTRGLMGAGFEVDVAFPTTTTFTQNEALMRLSQVGDMLKFFDDLAGLWVFLFGDLGDHSAAGYLINDVFRTAACAGVAFALFTVIGDELRIVEESAQAVRAGIDEQDDAAAMTAIASVWATFGAEFTSVEMNGAVATFTGAGIDFDLIDKHGPAM